MGKFLKKIVLFYSLLVAVCLLLFGFQNWQIRKNANFKFSQNTKYLVAGHSHSECAYNDSLISNFKNIATSGESYFYTYQKLKEVLRQNEQLKMVFVEFTNNQIDAGMDTWIWGDKYISKFYPKYGSFMDLWDTGLLLKHNTPSVVNNFSVQQKRNLMDMLKNDYDYRKDLGGYVYYNENRLESAIRNQLETKKNTPLHKLSHTNIDYLRKILSLCDQHQVAVIFVRSPQHSLLKMRKNEAQFLKVYSEAFTQIPFLDFNNFNIPDDGYKDLEHLNYKGARIISVELDSLLKDSSFMNNFLKNPQRVVISE